MAAPDLRLQAAAGELGLAAEELRVARLLAAHGHLRQAVRSLYYGAYHTALAVLAAQGLKAEHHGGVPALFIQHFVKAGLVAPEAAQLLATLFQSRLAADYDAQALFDAQQWRSAAKQADGAIQASLNYLGRDFPSLDLAPLRDELAQSAALAHASGAPLVEP